MRKNQKWWPALLLAAVLAVPFAAVVQAQTTTTTEVNQFEILAVDGNNLVVRNEKGTHDYVVPDDFRFTVDGKKLSVKELKPGMKGTATVTTKTTLTPVTVTEIKEGTVVSATNYSVNVRSSEGVRRFTQSELDDRGVQILKEGRIIRIRDLKQGDHITATIFSKAPPVVLTEMEVQATLAQAAPAAAAPAPATTPAATPAAAAAPSAAAPPASPAPAKAAPAQTPATEGTPWLWYILIAVVLVLLWFFVVRKKEKR